MQRYRKKAVRTPGRALPPGVEPPEVPVVVAHDPSAEPNPGDGQGRPAPETEQDERIRRMIEAAYT